MQIAPVQSRVTASDLEPILAVPAAFADVPNACEILKVEDINSIAGGLAACSVSSRPRR